MLADECWHKSLVPLMEGVRKKMGDRPVYISFDIDGIDPGLCPGTGKSILVRFIQDTAAMSPLLSRASANSNCMQSYKIWRTVYNTVLLSIVFVCF